MTQPKNDITAEQADFFLDYDKNTGVFKWKTSVSRNKKGSYAGYVDSQGYVSIGLLGRSYRAHRLAFLIVNRRWPENYLDHINGDRSDNRIENIREATSGENAQNKKSSKSSSSKYIGVFFCKETGKWRASIKINGKSKALGRFADEEDAARAYVEAKKKMHSYNPVHVDLAEL